MNTIIITGGTINKGFLEDYLLHNKFDTIIAVDRGLEILDELNIKPNYIIGDFDSVDKEVLKRYENINIPITYLKAEKDYTDTHEAIKLAIEIGSKEITIIGAIGTRIDHSLSNINILKETLDKNITAKIVNENNQIMLIDKETIIKKYDNYKYISIIPLTTKISGISLKGFKYSLENAEINIGESIGISNEQIEDEATIKIEEGIAVLVFSKD